MPLPGSEELRRPLLEAFKGEAPRNFSINEILEIIADHYGLNLNDFSSGDKNILRSRINEAKADLKKYNLLYNPSGNTYMITNAGTEILEDGPEIITNEYLKARKKKPLPLYETLATAAETEIMSDPEILPDNNAPKDSESDSIPETETLAVDETPPEIDTNTDSDITLGDKPSDFETSAEIETLTDDDTAQDSDITLDDVPSDFETSAEIEPITNDDTAQDSDITLQDETSDFEPQAEIEPLTDNDTAQESDINTESEAMPENDTFEDSSEQETDETPGEILDTEEVQTETMPEDTYELEETQEDFTDESEPQESNGEDYSESESDSEEEEYDPEILSAAIPSNSIDDAIARHNSELADQLLIRTAGLPSDRFEMLVIDLLSKMGYFAFQTARYTTESSGSEMIHGVILDNKTGANIYIQARKLSPGRTVSKADIQDFIDELADKGGKGIYATTANFSENAKVLAADERLMLIDGEKLANLMIANNFCVSVEKVYEIKAIDSESFSEYE